MAVIEAGGQVERVALQVDEAEVGRARKLVGIEGAGEAVGVETEGLESREPWE